MKGEKSFTDQDIHEVYLEEAFLKRLNVHTLIGDSAMNYIRTLFNLVDNRTNGHEIDLRDTRFTPNLFFEVKEGLNQVNIKDFQMHYPIKNSISKNYLVAVERVDDLKTYYYGKKKGKKVKLIKEFHDEENLLFNFGNIFVLPFEIIEEHYLVQRTKTLIKDNFNKIGKNREFKDVHSLNSVMRRKAKKELEIVKKKRFNDESITHEDRFSVDLTFSQVAQLVIGYGPHYDLVRRSKTLQKERYFTVFDGPLIYPNSKDKSKIFLMDFDEKVFDDFSSWLLNKSAYDKINELKQQRLSLYNEIKSLDKENFNFNLNNYPDLRKNLESLVNWKIYNPNQLELSLSSKTTLLSKDDLPF